MAAKAMDFLWQEFFRDPSQFWDNRHTKRSTKSPDFRHKLSKKPLWIHGFHNPPWVQALDLNKVTLQSSSLQSEDHSSLLNLIRSCGKNKDLHKIRNIHYDLLEKKTVDLKKEICLATALLSTYAKCGAWEEARKLFEKLHVRDVVSWTALIAAYVQQGMANDALECFHRMKDEGVNPDVVTYICILKACGILGSTHIGELIHTKVRRLGSFQKNPMLGNALVDMYAKCGDIGKAQEVFEKLPVQDVVSWNALISGYVKEKLLNEALECFWKMKKVGVYPDAVTYTCILKICGMVGSLEIGEKIHTKIKKQGLLQRDILLGNTLVDMYVKCGALERAQDVFEELPVRNIVSWTAMMAGFAQLGEAKVVLGLFEMVKAEGIAPDLVMFLILLSACNHAGLLKEGEKWFDEMCTVYSFTPTIEHYTCMIDLYSRKGRIDKAKALLDRVSSSDRLQLLLTILGVCFKEGNVNLGEWAFEQSVEIDEKCIVAYVSMENLYATASMQT